MKFLGFIVLAMALASCSPAEKNNKPLTNKFIKDNAGTKYKSAANSEFVINADGTFSLAETQDGCPYIISGKVDEVDRMLDGASSKNYFNVTLHKEEIVRYREVVLSEEKKTACDDFVAKQSAEFPAQETWSVTYTPDVLEVVENKGKENFLEYLQNNFFRQDKRINITEKFLEFYTGNFERAVEGEVKTTESFQISSQDRLLELKGQGECSYDLRARIESVAVVSKPRGLFVEVSTTVLGFSFGKTGDLQICDTLIELKNWLPDNGGQKEQVLILPVNSLMAREFSWIKKLTGVSDRYIRSKRVI